MSSCRDRSRELLPEFVHASLDPAEMAEVEGHLETCRECAFDVQVLRELGNEVIPDPDPWFYSTLPGKVVAQGLAQRKRKKRMFLTVCAGSAAAAAAAALLVITIPPTVPYLPGDVPDYTTMRSAGIPHVGLEEEILSASGAVLEELELPLLEDLGPVSEEFFASRELVPGGDGYEMMDEETMKVFEDLVEEMTRERVGKKVTS